MRNLELYDKKTRLRITINKGRYYILFMVLLSVANIFMITTKNGTMMPYSSAISNNAVAIGLNISEQTGNSSVRILGLIIACAVLLILMICYILSKNKSQYLVIASALIAADTIVLLVTSIFSNAVTSFYTLLDLLVHVLAFIFIIFAIRASKELHSISKETNGSAEEKTPSEEEEEEEETAPLHTDDSDIDRAGSEDELSDPIRVYEETDLEPLVQGNHNGLEVFVVIRKTNAELVINGYVCDELDISDLIEYQLRAIVNDVDFTFEYKRSSSGEAMYLYADSTLLDSLGIA